MVGPTMLMFAALLVAVGGATMVQRVVKRGSIDGASTVGGGGGGARDGTMYWQIVAVAFVAFIAELLYFGVGGPGSSSHAATNNGGSSEHMPPQSLQDLGTY